MMGVQSKEFFDNSTSTKDDWLRNVDFSNERLTVGNYFMFFTHSEDDLVSQFSVFRPVHTGYYSAKLRSDEGDGFHFTFCGVKDQYRGRSLQKPLSSEWDSSENAFEDPQRSQFIARSGNLNSRFVKLK